LWQFLKEIAISKALAKARCLEQIAPFAFTLFGVAAAVVQGAAVLDLGTLDHWFRKVLP
jgi:hypothetical protein